MAVVQHPNQREYQGGWQELPSLVVRCDQCGSLSYKKDVDPGKAAEHAREEGFITVRGERLSDPKRWLCPKCQEVRSHA